MASFKETQELLCYCYAENMLEDEEFLMLYDVNQPKNPTYPYWTYQSFDLEELFDDDCKTEFRFLKNDIYQLVEALRIPEEIRCSNRQSFNAVEALCILLKRLSYPCRLSDLIPTFGRSVPELSNIVSYMVNFVHNTHGHLLSTLQQEWLSPRCLQEFSDVIHDKGSPLNNCWGFIDGTVRPIARPGQNQRVLYNGHKRIHALKFQSVATPNGLIANLYGPIEGQRHDSAMLAQSGLLNELELHCNNDIGRPFCIYGDLAYPLRAHIQRPFQGARLPQIQQQFNSAMSSVRISVEWLFGDIINFFKFMDFKKNLKTALSPIGKMYLVSGILQNAHTILYGNSTSNYFELEPPNLQQYFV